MTGSKDSGDKSTEHPVCFGPIHSVDLEGPAGEEDHADIHGQQTSEDIFAILEELELIKIDSLTE